MSGTERRGQQGCWKEAGGGEGSTDGEGRPVRLSDHSSLISPLCLRDDLVQSSNNKTAYSNTSCGTYLGSHPWPTLREEGAASAMPARRRVRKRPRMAPAQFFSWRDGAVCLVSGKGLSTSGYLRLFSLPA
jgi:hypothetical protein